MKATAEFETVKVGETAVRIVKDSIYQVSLLKLIALLSLRRCVIEETYEACDYWIRWARAFGATSSEIKGILLHPQQSPEGI